MSNMGKVKAWAHKAQTAYVGLTVNIPARRYGYWCCSCGIERANWWPLAQHAVALRHELPGVTFLSLVKGAKQMDIHFRNDSDYHDTRQALERVVAAATGDDKLVLERLLRSLEGPNWQHYG